MENFTTDARICIDRVIDIKYVSETADDVSARYNITQTCKWITEHNFLKVCLQFPDELLGVSAKVYKDIKKRIDVDLYILGDTSYASCCVDSVAAMHVQGNAVVHYGRSCFSKTNIPVFTVLPMRDLDVDSTMQNIKTSFPSCNDVTLCLFYDAEFEHCKDTLIKSWFENYPHCYVAFVEIYEREKRFLGRIIRDKNNQEFEMEVLTSCTCVYLGSRGQTLFNYTISVPALEWYILDPDVGKMEATDETAWFKRRRFLIEKCKDANVIGILVCKLSGDQSKAIIRRMKELCKANQKKSYIVSVGKPNVAKLANFPEIDIYVMIACPENNLYSSRDFYKPIVYPFELEVAFNSNRSHYHKAHITDFDELLPGGRHHCDISNVGDSSDVSLITGRIRNIEVNTREGGSMELAERQSWALEQIGQSLSQRTWTGLEQKLGETEVKIAEEGRKGIPLQYTNEPE